MMQLLTIFFAIFYITSCCCIKRKNLQSGQYLGGQLKESDFDKDRFSEKTDGSSFVPGSYKKTIENESYKTKNHISPLVPGSIESSEYSTNISVDDYKRVSQNEVGQRVAGTYSKSNKFIEYKKEELNKEVFDSGTNTFTFTIFKDSYDYKNKNSTFKKTYRDAADSEVPLAVLISVDKFITRKFIDLSWGINGGIGYNRGPAVFSESQELEEDTKFTLWTLPLDLAIVAELAASNWLKLSFSAGPSTLGLIQIRNDREYGDEQKQRRQIGIGYFCAAKFKIGLSRIFSNSAFADFSSSGITSMFLNIEARVVNYNNFQNDDVSVSGTSLGIGFSFEYL